MSSLRSFLIIGAVLAAAGCGQAARGTADVVVDPLAPETCEGTPICTLTGACAFRDGICRFPADSDDDCQGGLGRLVWACEDHGQCAARDGVCSAVSDADCAFSMMCRSFGECVARDGLCWVPAETDAECRVPQGRSQTVACAAGHCSARDGICLAASDEDCRDECERRGRCRAAGYYCLADYDDECRASLACESRGECFARAGWCAALEDADCRAATVCSEEGLCFARQGVCSAQDDADCRASSACANKGRCGARDGDCAALDDADCRSSAVCRASGRCTAEEGECWAVTREDCAGSTACKVQGRCAPSGWECTEGFCYAPPLVAVVFEVELLDGMMDANCDALDPFLSAEDAPGKTMFIAGGVHADSPVAAPEIDSALGSWQPNRVAMHDDGGWGDDWPDDGIWTVVVAMPRGTRVGYKYTWGARGAPWAGTEEWPGHQRLLEAEDVDGNGIVVRHDRFGDQTTNKDAANLRSAERGGTGVVTWETDSDDDGVPDVREEPIASASGGECRLEGWPWQWNDENCPAVAAPACDTAGPCEYPGERVCDGERGRNRCKLDAGGCFVLVPMSPCSDGCSDGHCWGTEPDW